MGMRASSHSASTLALEGVQLTWVPQLFLVPGHFIYKTVPPSRLEFRQIFPSPSTSRDVWGNQRRPYLITR